MALSTSKPCRNKSEIHYRCIEIRTENNLNKPSTYIVYCTYTLLRSKIIVTMTSSIDSHI